VFDYVSSNVTLNATMVQTSSSIVVTLGTPKTPVAVTTALLPGAMTLSPASARQSPGHKSCSTTVAIEDYTGRLRVLVSGAVQ
jgi:hypothetical protein